MAPECFADEVTKYSAKTDVWAFGVFMFEVLERKEPYSEMNLFLIPSAVFKGKLRPEAPVETHPVLAAMMTRTWSFNPDERPTMNQIHADLHELFSDLAAPKPLAAMSSRDMAGSYEADFHLTSK